MGAFSDNLDFMKIVFPLQREHCFSGSEGSDFDDFWVNFSMLCFEASSKRLFFAFFAILVILGAPRGSILGAWSSIFRDLKNDEKKGSLRNQSNRM